MTITPGDRIEVLHIAFAPGEGVQGTVEVVQDLTRNGNGRLLPPAARVTVRGDDGRKVSLIIPPDRVNVIR
jgi:hypothetical protein